MHTSNVDTLKRHRRSCLVDSDTSECHLDEFTAVEAVIARECPQQSTIRVITFPRQHVRKLLSLQDIGALLPPVSKRFLIWTSYSALALVLLLPAVMANFLDPVVATITPHPPDPQWIFFIFQFIDPILIHVVIYVMLIWVVFNISVHSGYDKTRALIIGVVLPLSVLLVSFLLNDLLIKPALAFPRAVSYDTNFEPAITRALRGLIGEGDRVPSGFAVRQVTLSMLLYWFGLHFKSPVGSSKSRALSISLSILGVVLVIVQRLYVGAHDLFDVTLGLGYGIVIFWVSVSVITTFAYRPSKVILNYSAKVWFIAGAGMIFYSGSPAEWVKVWLTTFIIMVMIAVLDRNVIKATLFSLQNLRRTFDHR